MGIFINAFTILKVMLLSNSIRVLRILADGKTPRREFSSATITKCYKELASRPGALIEKKSGRFVVTEKGFGLLRLLDE